MNCRDCQDWLQSSLDARRIAPSPEAREHLRDCDSCRRDAAAARALLGGLAASFAPNALMTASIADSILTDRSRRRRRATYRWYATAGLAASLLAIFAIASLTPVRKSPTTDPVELVKIPSPSPSHPQPDREPDVALTQSADDARKAVASLTRSVAEKTKTRIHLLLPEGGPVEVALPPVPEFDHPLDPAAESLRQAGLSVALSLEPVTQTAVRAFDYFAREMPVFDFPKN